MLSQLISALAWLAVPATLVCVVDDWFLRPRRQLAVPPGRPLRDPQWLAWLYFVLPALIICGVVEVLGSQDVDFSAVLLEISVVTGSVWLVDVLVFRRLRARTAQARGRSLTEIPEPGTVDYARSFFPVALGVLVLRAFVFEPFRIPSDSMMPTLVDGDFILVSKYSYGLRLPVINRKILAVGEPQRGDVVVFRYPLNPSINYIKRLVGLPGDRVQVKNDHLIVNGQPVGATDLGLYGDGCYEGMHLAQETLGSHKHQIMFCPTPGGIDADPLATCNRNPPRSYVCVADTSAPDRGDHDVMVVPAHSYLMIGDNRDNSEDGRYWGYVPEDNLVGKATRIWFNWDWHRSGGPVWSRIGKRIE